MEKGQLWTVVGIALVVAVIASVATASITGNAIFSKLIKANSCDADSVCEVQGTISSGNALKLSSSAGVAKLESDLTLTKLGQAGGTVFKTNNEGSLTITPQSGSAKLEADLTLTKAGQSGGAILKTNDAGSLTITPQSGATKLESDLTLTRLGYSGGVVLKSNEMGSLTITPQSGASKIEGYLSVTNLAGNGTAYACVDSVGRIYRSLTACR